MGYQKINVELIVFSEEAAAVVAELNSAIDRLERRTRFLAARIETGLLRTAERGKSASTHT